MNTAMTRTSRHPKIAILGAFFAILAALLFGSVVQTSTASAQEPGGSAAPRPQQLSDGYLKICKVYEATGDADKNYTFKFLVEVDYPAADGTIDDSFYLELKLSEGGKGCTDPLAVPLGSKVTITEILLDGFNSAPGYPKYEVSGPGMNNSGVGTTVTFDLQTVCLSAPCSVLFWNKEDGPKRFPIRVCKVYLNNEDGVLNAGTIFDFDINGKPFNINAAESETNCKIVWVTLDNLNDDVTITEHLPGSWNSAPGYPKVEMDNNPFDDGDHGVSSNSITFSIGRCVEFEKPQLRTLAIAVEFACTIVFYNLEDVPGDECVPGRRDCPETTCEERGDCPEVTCEDRRECPEVTCEDLGNCPEEECRENCDDEPQCTEPCGEPLCAEDCDDTPTRVPGDEPKAPNTGTGMLIGTASNPMVLASAGIAIIMATVLFGTAALPKRR